MNEPTQAVPLPLPRKMLVFIFAIGALLYGTSLAEYCLYHLTGTTPFPVDKVYTQISDEALKQEFLTCKAPLFGASSRSATAGEPMLARCGRFWPFYYYTVELPASSRVPGAFIAYEGETPSDKQQREAFMRRMTFIHGGFLIVSLGVIGLAVFGLYTYVVREDAWRGYRFTMQAFISSFFMMGGFVGLLFFSDPTAGLGW